MPEFIPTAYVKTNCPFSFKFRLFITEARLAETVRFIALNPYAPDFAQAKSDLLSKVGHSHSFPIVEVEPETYLSDSDALIDYFAARHGVDPMTLPTLHFYRNGLYTTFLEMFHILATPLGWVARLGRKPAAFR